MEVVCALLEPDACAGLTPEDGTQKTEIRTKTKNAGHYNGRRFLFSLDREEASLADETPPVDNF